MKKMVAKSGRRRKVGKNTLAEVVVKLVRHMVVKKAKGLVELVAG